MVRKTYIDLLSKTGTTLFLLTSQKLNENSGTKTILLMETKTRKEKRIQEKTDYLCYCDIKST